MYYSVPDFTLHYVNYFVSIYIMFINSTYNTVNMINYSITHERLYLSSRMLTIFSLLYPR